MNTRRNIVAMALLLASSLVFPARARRAGSEEPLNSSRVQVRLILVDVVVTDRKGEPIRGLPVEQFKLLIDNTRVSIHSFEQHCRPPGDAAVSMAASLTGGTPRGEVRHMILAFDLSHMNATARNDAIRAARRFVNESMTAGDSVMVPGFLRGLHVISDFTGDRAVLLDRLGRFLDSRALTGTEAFTEEATIDGLVKKVHRGPPTPPGPHDLPAARAECLAEARLAEIGTARTLRLIGNTMPAFAGLPGRKALVLFTESLRANPGVPYFNGCKIPAMESLTAALTTLPEIDDLVAKANLAGVSFYPVQAAGMTPGRTPSRVESARDLQVDLALTTGGKNFMLLNDPTESIRQAKRDLSCYYVLSYEPPEEFDMGKHSVDVLLDHKRAKVRHRESFTIQSPAEASQEQILAVLSNPGMYREIPVEAHGYSLSEASRGKRRFLLKASVSVRDLTLLPAAPDRREGVVSIRGTVVADGKLRCEFSQTIPVAIDSAHSVMHDVGVETVCTLAPGKHEILVAARDEKGGSLGAFWGRVEVRSPRDSTGAAALLWAPAGTDRWWREREASWLPAGHEPFFIRRRRILHRGEPAVLTLLACPDEGSRTSGPDGAVVRLVGPDTVDLPLREEPDHQKGECRLLSAAIRRDLLSPGLYRVESLLGPSWHAVGVAAPFTVSRTMAR